MGGPETPLETRIAWANQKIDSCKKYLTGVFQIEEETRDELSCGNIVKAIQSSTKGEEADYKALIEKLVTEELLEVSTIRRR
jgi:hypothetical protein